MHIRITADLKDYALDYATRRNTNVSELITRFFVNLREKERREQEHPEDAESI